MPGPYIANAANLIPRNTPLGNGQCVAMVDVITCVVRMAFAAVLLAATT